MYTSELRSFVGFYLSELIRLKAVLIRISLQNVITCLCRETMGGQWCNTH